MANQFFTKCDVQLCAYICRVFACYGGFGENGYRNMNGLKIFMETLLSLHLQIVWKIYRPVRTLKMISRIWGTLYTF